MLMEAQKAGRISILSEASPSKIEEGWITIENSDSANLSAADTAAFRANLVKHIVALSGK